MSKQKSNGEVVLQRITALLVDVPRADPKYHREYMRIRYRLDKMIEPRTKKYLELQAESIYDELERLLCF